LEAQLETSKGTIVLELLPEEAPITVANFVNLANRRFYNGVTFHRVIADFMIQGGDPTATGRGGRSVWGEPFEDEVTKDKVFDKPGILAMANAGPGTNGSQFFITVAPTGWLNGKHTIFGEVVKGYDVVEKIEKCRKGPGDKPVEPQSIEKIYVKK